MVVEGDDNCRSDGGRRVEEERQDAEDDKDDAPCDDNARTAVTR